MSDLSERVVRLLRNMGRPSWTVCRPTWCSVGMGGGGLQSW